MKNKIILAAAISAAIVLVTRAADVSYYLVSKGLDQKQTNTTTIITQTNENPYRFLSLLTGTTTDAVNFVNLKLPSTQVRTLTNTDGSFQLEQGFSTKGGLDGSFAFGNYQFTIGTVNDGTNRPTLPLTTDAYPAAPVIANWADLQTVEPELPLYIFWNTFSNGTPDDFALLELDQLDGTPVVATPDLLQPDAMNGTNRYASVTAGTLSYGTNYEARLLFLKRTALTTTNYPGARGIAGYFRQTIFPVTTLPAPPAHGRIQFSVSGGTTREDAGAAQLTVTRAGTQGGVSVDIFTAGGTATAGVDYETLSETLHFEDGEQFKTVPISVLDDYLLESNETVNIHLANPTEGAELGLRTNLLLTILDNEIAAAGKFQFSATNYNTSEASNQVSITVNRSTPNTGIVTVSYATEDGTALGLGVDYGTSVGTLVFSNGVSARTFNIPVVNDALHETNKFFRVKLTATSGGAALGTNINSTVTITDNDLGGVLSFKPAVLATNENAGGFLVTVVRTGGTAAGVTVDYTTLDGTAEHNQDYTKTEGTLTFGSNVLSQTIFVPLQDDVLPNGNRTFTLTLTNATGSATISITNTATLTIKDDESSVSFTNTSFTVSEASSNLLVNVLRSGPLTTPVSVSFATLDDSAVAGTDYFATNGVLAFPTNTSTRSFIVRLKNNTIVDETRRFRLALSNPLNGVLLGALTNISVNLTNEDRGGTIRFATNSFNVAETGTNARITLLRTGGLASGVTVKFKVEDGTAARDDDYSNVTQIVTFNAGETNKLLLVPIINDTLVESPETVLLSLEDAGGGASLGSPIAATLTITSDDVGGVISFSRTNYSAFENGTNLFVTVNRTSGKASAVSVHYLAHSGTAISGDDFAETEGDLNFTANETNKVIAIPILNDTIADGNETFSISLSGVAGGATLGTITNAVLTIIDDESSIRIGSSSYILTEGVTNLAVTFFRDGSRVTPVSVDFATEDGSATAPGDYIATNGTLVFPTNVLSKTIVVRLINDTLVEENEFFNLHIFNPQNGVQIGAISNAEISITDNDLGGAIRFATNSFSVAEAGTNARITLIRTGGIASGVTVKFKVEDGSATAGADYSNATQVVTFNAGETNKLILVPVINDTIVENPETVLLTLEDATGGASVGSIASATLTITDNDLGGIISFASAAQSANENSTNFIVNVKRTGGAASGVTVDYSTTSGTATQDSDFSDTHGTLNFGAGETNKVILVPIINDTLAEGSEQFSLTLANAGGGATIGAIASTTLTVVDDESSISLGSAVASVSEAGTNVIITLIRSGASNTLVSVDFSTVNGTAIGGSDFGATNGTVTFAANTGGSKTIVIPIFNDSVIENNETFSFQLSNPQGGVQLGTITNETVTIENDDFAGTVQFSATTYSGTEGSNAVVTITRTGGKAGGVTVTLGMVGISALSGVDFTNKSGAIVFNQGETNKTVLVPLVLDALTEGTETVNMFLTGATGGATLGAQTTATLNIQDKPDPNAVPEVGAVFFNATVNGTAHTGLTITSSSYSQSGVGGNSLLLLTASKGSSESFSFGNLVANGTGTVTLNTSTANGIFQYINASQLILAGTTYGGSGGTVTIDVLNTTTKTITGRYSLVIANSISSAIYTVTGSFRSHWP